MAVCYKYAIIQFAPRDCRDERLNLGVIVFREEDVDIRLTKRIEKIHAISQRINVADVKDLVDNLYRLDSEIHTECDFTIEQRASVLSEQGPLSLSELGTFISADPSGYEVRISSLLQALVESEPPITRVRKKRSRLLTEVKTRFRREHVLAQKDENLSSHRIVPNFQLDTGLIADLALKNGHMHVIETVDVSSLEDSLRKAVGEIGVALLVLETAKIKFGRQTNSLLVYYASASLELATKPSLDVAAHQGAKLVNWASETDQHKFIQNLSSLAAPIEASSKTNRGYRFEQKRLFD